MDDPENPQGNGGPDNSGQTSVVNPDGTFVESWHEKYGAENAPTLSRFKKFDDLVQSHMGQRKMLGHDPDSLVLKPKDDSPDDVKQAFWKAGGWSENPEDYKYVLPSELKDKIQIEDDRMTGFKKFAQEELHLSPANFQKMLDYYHNMIAKDIDKYDTIFQEQKQTAFNNGMAELKKVLGVSKDDRAARANLLLQKYGEMELKDEKGEVVGTVLEKLFEEAPSLKNSPWLTLILDNIAEHMSEDTLKGIRTVIAPSSEQIDAKIAELRKNPAYMKEDDPQHKTIVAQLSELYKKKHSA